MPAANPAPLEETSMSNIARADPFQELARFDPFRDAEGFPAWPRLRRFFQDMPSEPTIKLEVTEGDKAFPVKAELPGVRKEDIAVEVEGNQVSISAEVRRDKAKFADGVLQLTLPKNSGAATTRIAIG
jgi:HSP20 family molecular chaperone IbpA